MKIRILLLSAVVFMLGSCGLIIPEPEIEDFVIQSALNNNSELSVLPNYPLNLAIGSDGASHHIYPNMTWEVNGDYRSSEGSYTFSESIPGDYRVVVTVKEEGAFGDEVKKSAEITITVTDSYTYQNSMNFESFYEFSTSSGYNLTNPNKRISNGEYIAIQTGEKEFNFSKDGGLTFSKIATEYSIDDMELLSGGRVIVKNNLYSISIYGENGKITDLSDSYFKVSGGLDEIYHISTYDNTLYVNTKSDRILNYDFNNSDNPTPTLGSPTETFSFYKKNIFYQGNNKPSYIFKGQLYTLNNDFEFIPSIIENYNLSENATVNVVSKNSVIVTDGGINYLYYNGLWRSDNLIYSPSEYKYLTDNEFISDIRTYFSNDRYIAIEKSGKVSEKIYLNSDIEILNNYIVFYNSREENKKILIYKRSNI